VLLSLAWNSDVASLVSDRGMLMVPCTTPILVSFPATPEDLATHASPAEKTRNLLEKQKVARPLNLQLRGELDAL
jgi:hypothetical protein